VVAVVPAPPAPSLTPPIAPPLPALLDLLALPVLLDLPDLPDLPGALVLPVVFAPTLMAMPATGTVTIVGHTQITRSGVVAMMTMTSTRPPCVACVVVAVEVQKGQVRNQCVPMVTKAAQETWMVTTAKITLLIRTGVWVILMMKISWLLLCAVLVVVAVQHLQLLWHQHVLTVMLAALAMQMATIVWITLPIQIGARAISMIRISSLPQCAVLAVVVQRLLVPSIRRRHSVPTPTKVAPVMWMVIFACNILPTSNGAWVSSAMMISMLLPCAVLAVEAQLWSIAFIENASDIAQLHASTTHQVYGPVGC